MGRDDFAVRVTHFPDWLIECQREIEARIDLKADSSSIRQAVEELRTRIQGNNEEIIHHLRNKLDVNQFHQAQLEWQQEFRSMQKGVRDLLLKLPSISTSVQPSSTPVRNPPTSPRQQSATPSQTTHLLRPDSHIQATQVSTNAPRLHHLQPASPAPRAGRREPSPFNTETAFKSSTFTADTSTRTMHSNSHETLQALTDYVQSLSYRRRERKE